MVFSFVTDPMKTALDPVLPLRFDHLYADHQGWLTHWLRRKLGCPHGAADLAQDTFLRLLSSGEAENLREPRAFLTTTANRLLISRARREKIEKVYLAELAIAAEHLGQHPSSEEILLAVEALNQICAVLEGLAEKPRQAFLLHYLDDWSHARIASHLNVSTKMVQKYLVKALVHCHICFKS